MRTIKYKISTNYNNIVQEKYKLRTINEQIRTKGLRKVQTRTTKYKKSTNQNNKVQGKYKLEQDTAQGYHYHALYVSWINFLLKTFIS